MSESHSGERAAAASYSPSEKEPSEECPTCGEEFESRTGMKIHHAQVHGESLAKEDFVCEWCGDVFEALPSSTNRFCGMDCKDAAHSVEISGESHPRYKDRVSVKCDQCGGEYDVKPSEKENTSFCSRKCQWEWQAENWRKDGHPASGEWFTVECKWCGEGYKVNRFNRDKTRFCSRECAGSWRSENIYGENHPQYKPGSDRRYGENWNLQRKKARKRDGHTCQSCGVTEDDHYRALSVHHIIPISEYKLEYDAPEWWKRGNDLSNLVTLCAGCHRKWEGIPLKPNLI